MITFSVLIFRVIITVKKTVISCYFSCWYFTDFACFSLTQNIRKIPPKKPTEFTCVQRHSFMPRLVPELWSWIMSRTYLAEYYNVTVNLTSELLDISHNFLFHPIRLLYLYKCHSHLWPPNSNQFILESTWTFSTSFKEIPSIVVEISSSQEEQLQFYRHF